ncbi:MAG: AraC family ligand binding domain-containing protein, partial [Oscillospiraceae bacterium]
MNIPRYNTHDFDPLTETGLLQQNSVSETAPLHTHEFFEMFLVTDGKALHLVNDSVQNIEGGDLVLIRPDDRHCYDFYKSFDFKFTNLAFPVKTMSLITELFLPDKPLAEMLSARLPSVAHLSPDAAAFIDSEFLKIGNLK